MRIAVCEDRSTDRQHLVELLRQYFDKKELTASIEEFESAETLLAAFQPGHFQILFLDVYLGRMSGLDAARKIREEDSQCALIFTTTSPDHALDSYTVRAADYLRKPFGQSQVEEALDWCMETLSDLLLGVDVVQNREKLHIMAKDILYIEVNGRVCSLTTLDGKVETNTSLKELEQSLQIQAFLRCHKSYLINMDYVLRPEGNDFLMKNGDRVPIGTDNLTRIKQSFFDYIIQSTWESR